MVVTLTLPKKLTSSSKTFLFVYKCQLTVIRQLFLLHLRLIYTNRVEFSLQKEIMRFVIANAPQMAVGDQDLIDV